MSKESVLPKISESFEKSETERMAKYKTFSAAFRYPDDKFFESFPDLSSQKIEREREYDTLFRMKEVWLYGAEYTSKTEFQRANYLSDIMGFYRAFGVDTDKDRPDLLSNELEFMYFLILKRIHARKSSHILDAEEKAQICQDAEGKFFCEHLYPAAGQIAEAVLKKTDDEFYKEMAAGMIEFLEDENILLGGGK